MVLFAVLTIIFSANAFAEQIRILRAGQNAVACIEGSDTSNYNFVQVGLNNLITYDRFFIYDFSERTDTIEIQRPIELSAPSFFTVDRQKGKVLVGCVTITKK